MLYGVYYWTSSDLGHQTSASAIEQNCILLQVTGKKSGYYMITGYYVKHVPIRLFCKFVLFASFNCRFKNYIKTLQISSLYIAKI